ncbi:MAG: hypothetical protein AAGA01_04730, partial [Cyanobacteria bacterium P01_E01_bin.43]
MVEGDPSIASKSASVTSQKSGSDADCLRPNAVSGSKGGVSISPDVDIGRVSVAKTSSLLNIGLDLFVAGMSAVGRSTPG